MFYMIYRFDFKIHLIFKHINPVVLLHKLFNGETKHKEYVKRLDDAMEEPQFGVSSMIASGILYGLYFLLVFGTVNYLSGILKISFNLKFYHFVLMALPSTVLLYFLVFKNDGYLDYFKQFKKISKSNMIVLSAGYFFNVILIICYVILSFVYMNYRDY